MGTTWLWCDFRFSVARIVLFLVVALAALAVQRDASANIVYPSWYGCTFHGSTTVYASSIQSVTWDYQVPLCLFQQVGVAQEYQAYDGFWWDRGWKWGSGNPYQNYVSWNTPGPLHPIRRHRVYFNAYTPISTTYDP
jgi:hypothetical protein